MGIGAFALIGFLFVAVSATPVTAWWARKLAGPWNDPRGDTLIVLGGSVLEGGLIGQSSYWRSIYGALVYKEGGFRRVVISGGPSGDPAAGAMKDFLISRGVPADAIATESASRSTHENAVNTARLLAGDHTRKVLLTSDFHMYRAARAFRKAGLEIEPRPFPDAIKTASRWPGRWPAFMELCVETVKIAWYYVRGWI
jgi:uncharacterized SAM-binding protein YcdF (DUF218 family)